MAYVPHNRLSIFGSFTGGDADIWNINLNLGGDLAVGQDASEADNDDLAALITTWYNDGATYALKQIWSPNVQIDGFKWNAVGADGKYKRPFAPNTYFFSAPRAGAGSTPRLPTQIALTVSLYTDLKGRRYRGRVYLPCDYLALSSNWRVPAAYQNNAANAFSRFITALNQWSGPISTGKGHVVVASQFGVNTPVTRVEVGNLVDTQRRRRNRLEESYSAAVVS